MTVIFIVVKSESFIEKCLWFMMHSKFTGMSATPALALAYCDFSLVFVKIGKFCKKCLNMLNFQVPCMIFQVVLGDLVTVTPVAGTRPHQNTTQRHSADNLYR